MSDLRFVRNLLAEFPDLRFDVIEHLYGCKHAPSLEQRFDHFQAYLSGSLPAAGQDEQKILSHLRDSLAQEIPAYGGLGNARRFHDLPFCDKDLLRARPDAFIPRGLDFAECRSIQTSGTSGSPVTILYSPLFYLEYLHLAMRKVLAVASIKVTPERFPTFCLYVDVRDTRRDKELIIVDPTGHVGITLLILVDESDHTTLARVFRLAELFRPALFGSRPHLFEVLLAYSAAVPRTSQFSARCVLSTGSMLSERTRQDIKDVFGADVFESYGLTECGLVALECAQHRGLHVDETSALVEVIDCDGNPLDPGAEGELVVSTLTNSAMPLLRYRTGDIGALDGGPCACGHPGPRIVKISGRRVSRFRFRGGLSLATARFNSLFWLFPIADYRVVQASFDRLEISVEPSGICADVARLVRSIEEHLQKMVPCPVDVAVQATTLTGGCNAQRHISLVKGPPST